MEQLRQITDALLLPDHGEHDDAVLKLHSLLSAISGLDNDPADSSNYRNTVLAVGEAISPGDASRCVIDSARTSKFLRGIHAALLEAQQRFLNGPIEILYAGCGPFATLAIPMITQFKPDQIRFTLLDIHARSLALARRIIETLGLRDYVREYIQSDAASYIHPRPLHMVITETMQKALSKEPQVAITLKLAPQLCPGGILIPERVIVDAYLCDPHKEFSPGIRDRNELPSVTQRAGGARIKLGRVFELTAETALKLTMMNGKRGCYAEACLQAAAIDLPMEIAEGLTLMLATTITVFGMITLEEYESGLTHPLWFYDFSGAKGRDRIEFQYCFKGSPGFKWQMPV
ncbi:MAG TPA: hypothetical protein VKN18_16690 [Blastocatellia bacterium]|nr:hypothetical protein [Blastocatellia bacterium]